MINGYKKTQRLADLVLVDLKKKIMDHLYEFGAKLPSEFELMKEYEVGRSTIREAIKILVHAGYLKIKHGQGTFVVYNEPQEKQNDFIHGTHIAETRLILEQAIVKLAVERRSEADLVSLREVLNRRNEALSKGAYSLYIQEDIAFHIEIAKAANNPSLLYLYQEFAQLLSVHLNRFLLNIPNYNDNTAIHEELYTSIFEQNEKTALKCTAANIQANESNNEAGVNCNE
ncbi:FadR/GntR family transcriptional regulator [Gorillibacterium massiliense]|uniref:FadR/GntR family transcriptional regulator n=1 Tax=Gorillibacterium massiliense TaxID=1280390 RepID=UPI00069433B5|nr:GntR family transcriptional regulator [Gorillibacterium massiliense]